MVKANGDFAAEFKCLKKLIIFSAITSLVCLMPGGAVGSQRVKFKVW